MLNLFNIDRPFAFLRRRKFQKLTDQAWHWSILLCGLSGILVLGLVIGFILREAWPVIDQVGLWDILTSSDWHPTAQHPSFGILSLVIGTLYVTGLAILLAVPLGILCAVFLAEVAPNRIRQFVRPAIEVLVGIPSVVYGLVGLTLLVPLIDNLPGTLTGHSILAGGIVVSIMVLPTIVSISEDSMRAVPSTYKEGALALGATRWQMMWHVVLPAARSGILAAIVLGMGRAIGETMAVYMVMGNSLKIPFLPTDSGRTLTTTPALEVGYASGDHLSALFVCGVVLLIFILSLNSIAMVLRRRQLR